MITRTVLVGILAGSVVVLSLFHGLRACSSDIDLQPAFTVASVTRGDITQGVSAVGQLSPLTTVEISSQISGLVTEVNVDFNSRVTKGQLLARIDSSTFRQRLRQAEAARDAADASHKLLALDSARLDDLRSQGLVSQQEVDHSKARLQEANAALLTSQAALANSRVDIERCAITSPIDGVVIYKQIEVGKTVVSSFNAPTLFTISPDLSRMKVLAKINEADIGQVQIGQHVSFTVDAFPSRSFDGILTQIRNPYTPSEDRLQSTQGATITMFDAVVEVSNTELLLRPGATANLLVVSSRLPSALQIPNSALRIVAPMGEGGHLEEAGSVSTVYIFPSGNRRSSPVPRRIRIGISDGIATEVVSGLNEGDLVVTGSITSSAPAKRGLFEF